MKRSRFLDFRQKATDYRFIKALYNIIGALLIERTSAVLGVSLNKRLVQDSNVVQRITVRS